MSYLIIDISAEYTDRTTGNRQIRAEIIADSVSDLPANTTALTYLLGTHARTVDTGDIYYIDSTGTWIQQPSPNQLDLTGYYTSAETDTLLSGKQDNLTTAQLAAANSGITAAKLIYLENSVLKIVDKEYKFSDYTFVHGYGTGNNDGKFYIPAGNLPSITGIAQIWSLTIVDWVGLMPTEDVIPYVSANGTKVGFMSNVGTFTSVSAKLVVRIVGQ